MDEHVEPPERLSSLADGALDVLVRAHVALGDERTGDRVGEIADAVLDPLALVRERQLRTLVGEAARDRPCDRPLVGDAENQAALPLEAIHDAILRRIL